MARRVAVVRTVPNPYKQPADEPVVLGHLIDPGDGQEPFGTTDAAHEMLSQTRPFDFYHGGWSNGYVETRPLGDDEASELPDDETTEARV